MLFGRRFDADQFDIALRASQLQEDVDSLPGGIDAQVGENGVTLRSASRETNLFQTDLKHFCQRTFQNTLKFHSSAPVYNKIPPTNINDLNHVFYSL